MNIYKGTLELGRYGDGAFLPLGKKLAAEAGARPDQLVRVSIRKVAGECILTARWTPQYPAQEEPRGMVEGEMKRGTGET